MKTSLLVFAVISALIIGCDSKKSSSYNRFNFIGTTWAMHLKGNAYNYIWLSCDSTFIYYNDNIENLYYGRFEMRDDTLLLSQEFEDDYFKYGSFPIKRKSIVDRKYLILNDSIIEFVSRDDSSHFVYSLKQRFDCESIKHK
jgi:hypothetical protein